MDTVLIADRDLGFVFWLGEQLHKLGFVAVPALDESQAAALAQKFPPDIVVFNPSFPRISGFLSSLRQSQGRLRVLALLPDAAARLEQFRDLKQALEDAPELDVYLREHGQPGQSEARCSRADAQGVVLGAA